MLIVLLPGMDGTGFLFKPLLHRLGALLKIKIINYPCYGTQSYEFLTEYVYQNLPKNNEFILVAESFSGPIAYLLALRGLRNLKGIVFAASFLRPPRPFILNALRRSGRFPLFNLIKRAPEIFIRYFLRGPGTTDSLVSLFRKSVMSVSELTFHQRLNAITRFRLSAQKISIPCCYIKAGRDILIPDAEAAFFERHCIRFEHYNVDGSHFILQSNPKKCAEIISDFISGPAYDYKKL